MPTGNFGDIFAGFIAREMGVPIKKLILATNANNILSRFVLDGDYSTADVHQSLSPSMDIQIASNLERYLYYLCDRDSLKLCSAMEEFKQTGKLLFNAEQISEVQKTFSAATVDDDATVATINDFFAQTGYILDPHTAVGVAAGRATTSGTCPLVCLATAHPAKFGAAVKAAIGQEPVLPPAFQGIEKLPKRFERIPSQVTLIRNYVAQHAL